MFLGGADGSTRVGGKTFQGPLGRLEGYGVKVKGKG